MVILHLDIFLNFFNKSKLVIVLFILCYVYAGFAEHARDTRVKNSAVYDVMRVCVKG
jgi:hypothetical protein